MHVFDVSIMSQSSTDMIFDCRVYIPQGYTHLSSMLTLFRRLRSSPAWLSPRILVRSSESTIWRRRGAPCKMRAQLVFPAAYESTLFTSSTPLDILGMDGSARTTKLDWLHPISAAKTAHMRSFYLPSVCGF